MIVYSVSKDVDFATSLVDGPYANTNFGKAFREAAALSAADAVVLKDYEPYKPSYEAPASFAASPILAKGETIGVAVMQMPIEPINEIMTDRSGLGETGETYLVGSDNLMRSDSYLDSENRTVAASFANPATGPLIPRRHRRRWQEKVERASSRTTTETPC